ncbi:MAG: hypothetical protein WC761_05775 [Candidatus Paceibacterota bacterium]|jgi:hypothetical protein
MKKFDIKILLKKWKHAFKDIGSDADKDWKIVLVGFVVFLTFCIAFHAKIFIEMQSVRKNGGSHSPVATELINTRALDAVLSVYDDRASQFESIATTGVTFVDPAR